MVEDSVLDLENLLFTLLRSLVGLARNKLSKVGELLFSSSLNYPGRRANF